MINNNVSSMPTEGSEPQKVKPNSTPPKEDFKKWEDRPKHKEEKKAAGEVEERPSVFDLSKSKKADRTGKPEKKEEGHATGKVPFNKPKGDVVPDKEEPGEEDVGFLPEKPVEKPTKEKPFVPVVPEKKEVFEGLEKPPVRQQPVVKEVIDTGRKESPKVETKEEKKSRSTESTRGEREVSPVVAGSTFQPVEPVAFRTDMAEEQPVIAAPQTVADLATELVDKIQVMEKGDETVTTVTLRQPPLFAGAQVTLTNTRQAEREFNIAFTNLNPQAEQLLHRMRDSLTENLHNKGITAHVVLITQVEARPMTEQSGASRDQQQRGDQQQQQQQGGGGGGRQQQQQQQQRDKS